MQQEKEQAQKHEMIQVVFVVVVDQVVHNNGNNNNGTGNNNRNDNNDDSAKIASMINDGLPFDIYEPEQYCICFNDRTDNNHFDVEVHYGCYFRCIAIKHGIKNDSKNRNGNNNNNSNNNHVPDGESLYRWKCDACKYRHKYQKLFDIGHNPNIYPSPRKQALNKVPVVLKQVVVYNLLILDQEEMEETVYFQ